MLCQDNYLLVRSEWMLLQMPHEKTWQPFLSQTPEKEKAKEGETVLFGCRYHSSQGSSLNNLTVKWYKRDGKGQKDVMENNVTALENNTRIFLTGNLSEGDASLTILKVTASDHGTYYCQVILSNGDVVTGDGTKLRIQRFLKKGSVRILKSNEIRGMGFGVPYLLRFGIPWTHLRCDYYTEGLDLRRYGLHCHWLLNLKNLP
uniref:Ig-like domain-containing protein n=1 Tax=Naja naja TaxID=35670 RepID=A0A8C6VK69_NAJNA